MQMTPERERQAAAIERWLRVFHPAPGAVVELRALGVQGRRAIGECFADLAALTRRAVELDSQEARGCYFTLNPLRVELAGFRGSARAADVVRRHWLGIDADSVREAGTNSTDAERAAAWEVLDRARGLLDTTGLSGGVVGDSGNGWHLAYPIDMPNDNVSQAAIKAVLVGLAARCDSAGAAQIDPKVFDAPRIWKLYGTKARKGPASAERPHRWAQLIEGQPWEPETARRNTDLLHGLPQHWKRIDDMRRGRPGGEEGVPVLERARRYVAKMEVAVQGQDGSGKTFDVAQVLVRGFALDEAEAWPLLLEYSACCQPPWSEKELRHKLADAQSKSKLPLGYLLGGEPANGQAHTNGTTATDSRPEQAQPSAPKLEPWVEPVPLNAPPDAPSFPLETLPPTLRGFVQEVAWSCNVPPDFAAVPLLAVAGGAIGNSRRLLIKSSYQQSACLFAAIIGQPGTNKSAPLEMIAEPLEKIEHEFFLYLEKELVKWEAKDPDARPPRPTLKRCIVDDSTVEAIVKLMSDNPRGITMVRDELSALITGMNQYRDGGKGSDRQSYLAIWSGKRITKDRQKLEGIPIKIRRPFMALIGTMQPGIIEWLRGEQRDGRPPPDDGFLDRFLLSYPRELPPIGEQWRDVSEAARTFWTNVVRELRDVANEINPDGPRSVGLGMQRHEDGELYPFSIPLGHDARVTWGRLTQAHADEIKAASFPSWLRGPWAKLEGYAARISLIVHLLRWACGEASESPVDSESVERAWKIVAYFKGHAAKIYSMMGADPRLAEATHVLSWLARHPQIHEFSRRDLHRHLLRSFKSPDDLDPPLWRLVDHGYLRLVNSDDRKGPGRKASARYQVNPLWERSRIDSIDGIEASTPDSGN